MWTMSFATTEANIKAEKPKHVEKIFNSWNELFDDTIIEGGCPVKIVTRYASIDGFTETIDLKCHFSGKSRAKTGLKASTTNRKITNSTALRKESLIVFQS